MILKINKRFACDFNFIIKALVFTCILTGHISFAQDTVSLKGVEVIAKKMELSQIGKKIEKIDSTIKQQFKLNSIADLLSLNTPVFIKNYGPGALATTAFRGGNASQTALLWNGFNIQNAMLGQSDLSLMPSFLFDNVEVEYGGSSSLWGSGAVGGSIHLKNNSLFNQGLKTAANFGAGSFGLKNVSSSILYSKRHFISSSKIYNSRSDNNFNYRDTTDKEQPIKQQKNAGYNFLGLMQELKFLINSKQIVSVNAWINTNSRRLPSSDPKAESKIYQRDDATRITATWSFINSNFRSGIRAGFFEDKINYTDSLASLFSKSRSQTIIAENENYLTWHKHHQLNFGMNFTSSSATTNNYSATKTLSRASVLVGNKFSFLNDKWLTYISARAEYFSVGTLPVTANISTEYNLTKHFTLMASAARVYRQPTLNELYWLPGGNINLKPEQGYTCEGTINYKAQITNNMSLFVSGAAFSRKIDNWILWIPGANGNPTPINLQQVWSRGTETVWRIHYSKDKFTYKVNVITGYVLSTIEANSQENNNTVHKQLIYTPRYTVNANILIGYDKAALVFYNQYVGYRFTTSDNTQWLNPYQVSSLRLNYSIATKLIDFIVFAACNNLGNKNYTILSGRPMPLRNYEFGITIQTKNK
ncbi:MAG: TonB-dependent receptor [Bacteroidetes bacterium]|nr:TonB-dependent receptor [Bacteroidota bacterium]